MARPYRQLPGRRIGKAGGKLTVTAILLKVLALALKRFPDFNASIDLDSQEIVYKKFFNVGVGCGYASGLLVPVVKNGRAVPPGVTGRRDSRYPPSGRPCGRSRKACVALAQASAEAGATLRIER